MYGAMNRVIRELSSEHLGSAESQAMLTRVERHISGDCEGSPGGTPAPASCGITPRTGRLRPLEP